ncbi:MAG: transcriptional repressor [Pseudomonadota bacterium]
MNTEKVKQTAENTSSLYNPGEALRAHGIYPTSQRKVIANILLAKHQHLTAEQIYSAIRSKDSKVSQATIYNTLGLFVKKGLLREVFVDSSKTFYDTNTQAHHHFYNVDTGELIDIQKHLEPSFTEHELPPATQIDSVDIIVRIKTYPA